MPDSYRKYKHHWSPNSKMLAVYEHLTQADILAIQKDGWTRYTGQETKNESHIEQSKTIPLRKCLRCQYDNPTDLSYCDRCGFHLDQKQATEKAITAMQVQELIERLSERHELVQKLLKVIKD